MNISMMRFLFFTAFFLASNVLHAQECRDYFPDGLQSHTNPGTLTFYWGSKIVNSPDNILDTGSISDGAGAGTSCNGVSCAISNSTVASSNYNTFPNNSNNITVVDGAPQTLLPGNYNNITLNNAAILNLQAGLYLLRGNLSAISSSRINIVSGTVVFLVRGTVSLNDSVQFNGAGAAESLLLYSRGVMSMGSNTLVHGFVYTGNDITFNSQAAVLGAVTARNATLNSPTTITYDSTALSVANFSPFCTTTPPPLPAPVAEYRLENSWLGNPNEVIDSSANGLNGRAIRYNGNFPTPGNLSPAIAGDPGTCRYGIFNGTNSGHLRVEDNSLLDFQNQLTVGAWIYPTALPASGGLKTIVSKDQNFEFHLNPSGDIFWWWGGGSRQLTTSGLNLSLNAWHHIAITYTVGEQKIYVDGTQRAATNFTSTMTLNNDPLLIGTDINFDSRNFSGRLDEVNIFNTALTAAQIGVLKNRTHPCNATPQIGSFVIDIGGAAGSVCYAKAIGITALDTDGSLMTSYTGAVTLSTSLNHGDWSVISASAINPDPPQNTLISGPVDSGGASYTFAGTSDAGTITLYLSNQHAEILSVNVADAVANITSSSAPVTFSENAFVVNVTDSLNDDVVAGRDHSFSIDMVRKDPVTGVCGKATNYNASLIKAWIAKNAQDPGGAVPGVKTATGLYVLPLFEPGAANVTFPFVNGTALFDLVTSDVGKYVIHFKDDNVAGFSTAPILGSSATLIVRPFALDVNIAGNPSASDATGPRFIAAGENFQATVRAVLWSANDDLNNDGQVDGHVNGNPLDGANLADNASAVSFGLEVPTEGVALSSVLVAPSSGSDPGLGNGETSGDGRLLAIFVSGSGQSGNLYHAEVGVVELNSRILDADYLGAGARTNKILGSSYVGRFTPAHFSLTPLGINEACGSFSYMEQAFSGGYRLTAQNARTPASTTANYQGAFAKLDDTVGTFAYGAIAAGNDLSTRLAGIGHAVSWLNGVGDVTLDTMLFTRQVSTAPDGPFTGMQIGVAVSDSDGVQLSSASLNLDIDGNTLDDHGLLGETTQRYGRLYAKDAFGPESTAIPMFWQTEFFNGARFVRNADDNCSQLAFSQINFSGASTSLDVANQTMSVTLGGVTSVFDFSDPLGTTACMTGTDIGFCSGHAGIVYGATGATMTYPVNIDLTNYPQLRFDWNADGNFSDLTHPQFKVNFQTYRGHDRVIFWRERL